jgi:hypothetical protein
MKRSICVAFLMGLMVTDYGLKQPKALLGTVGTKNEMEFSFSLELRVVQGPDHSPI